LLERSHAILDKVEQSDLFIGANCVALYEALPGEVQTAAFIEKWYKSKTLLLPIVEGNDLKLSPYAGPESLRSGAFGILEPTAESTVSEKEIDLIIVPGIAFDRALNRMGRGKGFYDRLLSSLPVPKMGICFDFQLFDKIPCEPFDIKMDCVISESEIVRN